MMPPTPLSRCALYCALALAATPALADTVTLTELPAPDGYPVAGVSNIAADGTVIGTVFPDGLVVRWTPGAAPEVLGGGMTYTFAKAQGGKEVSPAMLEGFSGAKVLIEGLRRAGPKPTREKVQAALEGLQKFDIGGLDISYSPEDHSGLDFADLSIIGADGKFMR